ncbi:MULTISPECIES: hypothetical protein [Micrococcales]|uniref:Uncharacterized protein n=1 Tax=Sediminivirga luteola TaxID=1774748 RepID=A0A8J2TYB3_9MICO|nr:MULTISPECIES: hypothetical protein [Micrococcales]GGA15774.1 hypothetical protein GCM10011333_18460 [Sediminivirga luteola]|tara:strand:+ start:7106 stop:8125 length:1020 start_codon:yes stop_codon:yes gene_type:complete
MSFTPSPLIAEPIWDMLGSRMPRGVLGLSDPDVHLIDGRWVMFIGGFSATFRNRLYRARLPVGAEPGHAGWMLDRHPITPDPPKGSWDAGGMHTPSYVPPHKGRDARIYYAGRASARHYGEGSAYAIGVLTRGVRGEWLRRDVPALAGWPGRASVLEPLVVAVESGYRMWFLATPHEVAPGEQPDFELHVADSVDGIEWEPARRFATTEEGFFDNAVYRTPQGWEMMLARGTNLHGTTPYPSQGLWLMRATRPSPDRADWSVPQRLLDTDVAGIPSWMGRGVCGPSVVPWSDGRRVVFLTGTHDIGPWWQAARFRMVHSRRLPVTSPYFLATGAIDVSI